MSREVITGDRDIVQEVVDMLLDTSYEIEFYYDKDTKKFFTVSPYTPHIDEEVIEQLIPLPKSYDIDEYDMMAEFVSSLSDERKINILSDTLRRKGAARLFRAAIRRLGVEQDWYKFRDEKYYQIAKEWCAENGLV
jgi:hypothetical protein